MTHHPELQISAPRPVTVVHGDQWGAFEKAWHAYEDVGDEDEEADAMDDDYGGGTLEEAENGRRELNGEFELAVRGYGEWGKKIMLYYVRVWLFVLCVLFRYWISYEVYAGKREMMDYEPEKELFVALREFVFNLP